MLSVHKQKTRDRVSYIQDNMISAQGLPKSVTDYIRELSKAIGDDVADTRGDAKAFLSQNPTMAGVRKRKG